MELTEEQIEAAKACGCAFFPATEAQVARLAMQRRIFTLGGGPFVAMRDGGGFHETHATLAALIEAHGRGEAPGGETMQQAAAADSASAREIDGERGGGGGPEVRRPRATTRPRPPWRHPQPEGVPHLRSAAPRRPAVYLGSARQRGGIRWCA